MTTIVTISDLQTGSNLGIGPEQMDIKEGDRSIRPNKAQAALLKAYNAVVKAWGRPDILVANGDLVEGQQPRNRGVEVWSTNLHDQVDAAAKLLTRWHAKRLYVVRGTPYHVMLDGVPVEEQLAKDVGAIPIDGHHSVYELFLDVHGCTFHFAHHIESTKVMMYRATAITRELALAMLNASHKYPVNVLVRSHVQYYWHTQSSGHDGFITPGWQLQTPYMMKLSPSGMVPDIGALRFRVDADGTFHFDAAQDLMIFPTPKPTLVRV